MVPISKKIATKAKQRLEVSAAASKSRSATITIAFEVLLGTKKRVKAFTGTAAGPFKETGFLTGVHYCVETTRLVQVDCSAENTNMPLVVAAVA